MVGIRDGEMAQQLKATTSLAEDLSLGLPALITLYNSELSSSLYRHCTHKHDPFTGIHIIKNKPPLKFVFVS